MHQFNIYEAICIPVRTNYMTFNQNRYCDCVSIIERARPAVLMFYAFLDHKQ